MQWTVQLEGGPRRVNHAAVAIDNKVYSFGGYCSGETLDPDQPIDIHALNTITYRWQAIYAVNEKKEKKGVEYSDVMEVDEEEGEEESEADDDMHYNSRRRSSVPYQRYGHTVCAFGGKAYLWGGRNDEFGASSALHEFDPATRRWSLVQATGRVPPARDGHSAVVVGNKMYLFGGFEEELQRFSQETYAFDFDTLKWSEVHTYGTAPLWRDFHTAVAIDNKMYVFGGRSDQMGQFHSTRDIYDERLKCLDLTTGEWSEPVCTGIRPGGRRSHSAWTHGGKMFIFGGYLGTLNKHYDELFSFDPQTKQWSKVETLGRRPEPRRRQCTVMCDERLFLFGGTMPIGGCNGSGTNGLADLADLYVLDYAPTLRNLAARVVIDRGLHKRFLYALPRDVSNTLFNMITPNSITNPPATRIDAAG